MLPSLFPATLNPVFGQVLISLLLGDKLNSGKVEFGLDGGANFSSLAGVPDSDTATGFHLGFYFDIKTSKAFHTGVIVKSPLGAQSLVHLRLMGVTGINLRIYQPPPSALYRRTVEMS